MLFFLYTKVPAEFRGVSSAGVLPAPDGRTKLPSQAEEAAMLYHVCPRAQLGHYQLTTSVW